MANMSYCRFQNTLQDLKDCYYALEDMESLSKLSQSEMRAALEMEELLNDMMNEFDRIREEESINADNI